MKIACIQLSTGEDYYSNIKQNLNLIKKAINNKSDLIITPEVSSIMTPDRKKLYQYSFQCLKILF